MLDFAKVTGIRIQEGSAQLLTIGGQTAWSAKKDRLVWTFNGSLPSEDDWSYTPGADTVYVDSEKEAVAIQSVGVNEWTTLDAGLPTGYLYSSPAVFEVEFMYGSTGTAGKTVIELGAGLDKCVRCEIVQYPDGDAYIFMLYTNESGTTTTASHALEKNVWHTLRLELDADVYSYVILDGEVLLALNSSMLYQPGYEGACISTLNASVYVKKLRYSGFVEAT